MRIVYMKYFYGLLLIYFINVKVEEKGIEENIKNT